MTTCESASNWGFKALKTWVWSVPHTANNFGFMYSRKRISQNSFPNFIHIIPKSFMVFCQELRNPKRNYENQIWTYTVIHFVWVSAIFSTCTVVSVNETRVEDKLCTFTLESTHFIFNKCPIYTHDGASAKFSINSRETDYSVGSQGCHNGKVIFITPWIWTQATLHHILLTLFSNRSKMTGKKKRYVE